MKKKINKILKIAVIIIAICIALSWTIKLTTGFHGGHYAFYFLHNFFKDRKIETEHFIIDLPKHKWLRFPINKEYLFKALPIEINKKLVGLEIYHEYIKDTEEMIDAINKLCDSKLRLTAQEMNNWKAEIYYCVTSSSSDIPIRYVIYENEIFITYSYIDEFKLQYDDFFKHVWLKEKQ